jgi:putative membrane protein
MGDAWNAGAGQTGGAFWQLFGIVGPALLAVLLLFLIGRALLRQSRYRVVGVFREEDQRAVHEAIAEAERRTVGEILPVVVERSDPHPGGDWLAALTCLLFGSAMLVAWLPWNHPLWLLLSQLLMGGVGFALARWLPDFKRLFVFEDRATKVAEEQAFQEFYAQGLHKTEAATGVLLFVSLFEHRAIIFADEGIDQKVDAEFWAATDEAILDGIRSGSLRRGLVEGIRRAGDLLAQHFPWREGDRNEIPDRMVIRRE